jgi:hypothetical protein
VLQKVCSLCFLIIEPTVGSTVGKQRRHHREVVVMTGLILLPCPHSFNVGE